MACSDLDKGTELERRYRRPEGARDSLLAKDWLDNVGCLCV